MRAAAIAILLVSSAFAACDFASEEFSQALPIIAAALLLTVAVAALAYMVGSLMKDAQLLVFSKDELFHTFISVLLVISIQGIFTSTCLISSDVLGGQDPITHSVSYLRGLKAEGASLLVSLMKTSIDYKFAAAQVYGYYFPLAGGETFFPYAFRNAYARHLDIAFDFVMMGMVGAGMQYEVMRRLGSLTLGILLPFGLILRALPRLRDAGNIAIALAFAAYISIPFTYAVSASSENIDTGFCTLAGGGGSDKAFGPCGEGIGLEAIALFIMKAIFLPNLVLVVFATAAGAMIKVAKVIP
ncbi:MAG: hypothetical protein WC350_00785 [Candidatus Micrarchaeia archaeon]|jgi:hypothetical protein